MTGATMTKLKVILLSAVAVGTITAAYAQNTGPGMSGTTTSPTQCWDVSSNMVKNRAPGADMTGAKNNNPNNTTTGSSVSGPSAPGTAGSASPGSGMGNSSVGGMAQQRPANMPNC